MADTNIEEVLFNKTDIDVVSAFQIFELYYGSIERNSDRRQNTNSFFLTLNTGIFAIIGFLFDKDMPTEFQLLYLMLPIAGILASFFWLKIVTSYNQLNSGKFAVLNEMEKLLPLAPFTTEWSVLGCGDDKKKYSPLTKIEKCIPILFIIVYAIFIVLFFFSTFFVLGYPCPR